MSSETCAYVARKSEPETWHGMESSTFHLDEEPTHGGLRIKEWNCPHPILDRDEVNHSGDNHDFCVFHTDPKDLPDNIDEGEEILKSLDKIDGSKSHRQEHRGQFIGATFGPIDLSKETIKATKQYGIRFDHAQFQSKDADINFDRTTFETEGSYPISFFGTKFETTGEGLLVFRGTTFRTTGTGSIRFDGASFHSRGDAYLLFGGSTFQTKSSGDIDFNKTTFRSDNVGDVKFGKTTFETEGQGDVSFLLARFFAEGGGDIDFKGATFRTGSKSNVNFSDIIFHSGGGDVVFDNATFESDNEGSIYFINTLFNETGNGGTSFEEAILMSKRLGSVNFQFASLPEANLKNVEIGNVEFGGVNLTGCDLRHCNIGDISFDGLTRCERLYEGFGVEYNPKQSSFATSLKRLQGSEFYPLDWDATAHAYHQLKTAFSNNGLVGKARTMHIRERRARGLQAKASNGWFDRQYLLSLFSRGVTGYGVKVQNLLLWMTALFLFSTIVYISAGVEDTLVNNISYSVLAFTVAPPRIPSGLGVQLVMMVETFFGTLSIVLLGYILGNRERF